MLRHIDNACTYIFICLTFTRKAECWLANKCLPIIDIRSFVFKQQTTDDFSLYHTHTGPSWSWSYGSWIYNYLCNRSLSILMLWVWLPLRQRCTTLTDKVCQWLAAGRWFSLGPSTNKTDRHHITEILLKVALNTIKPTNLYHTTIFESWNVLRSYRKPISSFLVWSVPT